MTAFWIATAAGTLIGVAYVVLAVRAFLDARRDALAAFAAADGSEASGRAAHPVDPRDDVQSLEDGRSLGFALKAGTGVVASTLAVVLISIDGRFFYLLPVLALGSALAVVAAFLVERSAAH